MWGAGEQEGAALERTKVKEAERALAEDGEAYGADW